MGVPCLDNIRIDEFIKYKFLSDVRYSPDGAYACFVVHEPDVESNDYKSYLCLLDVKKGSTMKLTSCGRERSFLWMDDSENILFQSTRDEKDKDRLTNGEDFAVFYKINIHGGEASEAFSVPVNANRLLQIDEDTFIFSSDFDGSRPLQFKLSEEEKKKELERIKEDRDYEILEEIPFWSNGAGFTSRKRNRLYIYHMGTSIVEPVTNETFNVESFHLDSDKRHAVVVGTDFTGRMPLINSVYLLNINTKNMDRLDNGGYNFAFANFISDNTIICAASDMKSFGMSEEVKFYSIDAGTKSMKCITPNLDVSLGNGVGSDCRFGASLSMKVDCGKFYYISTGGYNSNIHTIDEGGSTNVITACGGSVDGFDVNNGSILFIGMRGMKLQELYTLEGADEKQITDFNGRVLSQKKVSSPEKLSFETEPGINIDGWVIKPVDFNPDKKYPAILDIHGGPKTAYGEVFFHEMQYWANEGYFVFFCNPRGSDGRGNEFADIRGKYGTIDYDDIMRFTDLVLEKHPSIDIGRVGVTGGSYGGFMTNWIIGRTDRFKAAASQRSISNFISKFGTTDIGYFFVDDQGSGTPWNNLEGLWEHSPLKYADRVKTPTLFLHSDQDYRCYMAEALQMFTALKLHGIESRLCLFHGENHELSRSGKPKHRIRRLCEITQWFDHYLK